MRWGARSRTRRLASARLEFASDRRLRTAAQAVGFALLLVAGLGAAAWWYGIGNTPTGRLRALERENAALRAELARARTDLEFERSTRSALTAQVAELSQRAGELRNQVEFINAQNARAGRGH